MKYNDVKLKPLLRGLTIRSPEGAGETAVIEELDASYRMDDLIPILYGLEKTGVKNLVIDLSRFSSQAKFVWAAFLEGAVSIGSGFDTRYVGITIDEAGTEEHSFKKKFFPKITGSLEEAVKSFG